MTLTPGPLTDQNPAPSPIAPTARWRFERTEEDLQLLIWPTPDTADPERYVMRENEGHELVSGADRVLALSAQAAHGTFTPVPAPDQVASQIGVLRYRVISSDVPSHVSMVCSAPFANWTEQHPLGDGIASKVLVFGGDSGTFLDIAQAHGAVVEPGDD